MAVCTGAAEDIPPSSINPSLPSSSPLVIIFSPTPTSFCPYSPLSQSSKPSWKRFALLQTDDHSICVVYNEFTSETAIVREENETPNDRSDRGIRKGAECHNARLTLAHPPIRVQKPMGTPQVILLIDDAANRLNI
ncbi:hypothetical protein HYDPIDRAFT_190108 [Hydnomerulius pinastri MD-312]|uniref:Uncharacterized protein n=1 Tax=Hydnomerulius pinastri MD-312 TaxID=994086 RepID=A0A0C9V473_9AGAM|nr:hypothetical protein HYDPIDRAFT_190108 [Hydnomerulius pinastri MD-312]